MAAQLRGKRVAILAADGVERVEVEQPRDALQQAGAETDLLSLHDGEIQARNHDLEAAGTFPVDGPVADASVEDYDALLRQAARSTRTSCGWTKPQLHSSETLWTPASRLQPFAMARGRWWRPELCLVGHLPRTPASVPIYAMPVPM